MNNNKYLSLNLAVMRKSAPTNALRAILHLAKSLVCGVALIATAHAAPTSTLTSPANNAVYLTGGSGTAAQANVIVQASAVAEVGRTINRVEFYANGNLIGTDPTATYRITWSNVAAGSYSITARAIDSANESTDSAPRTITISATNTPPTATLNSPPANARYNIPVAVTLGATVSAKIVSCVGTSLG